MLSFEEGVSLRERKQAKTKVFLIKEFLESLKHARYEDISIKSICERAEVSEGTFYNYFPQKTDMFNYIISLYGTRKIWLTDNKVSREEPIKWLKVYLENVVVMVAALGNLSNEIFSSVVREGVLPEKINIGRLEFLYMFPDMEEGQDIPDTFSIDSTFEGVVRIIAEKGLLRKGVSEKAAAIAIKLVLAGIPLIRAMYGDREADAIVEKQFDILLRGVVK